MQDNEVKNPDPKENRRKFLKRAGIVAGGATVATVVLLDARGLLFKHPPSSSSSSSPGGAQATSTGPLLSADAFQAYAYLGPSGNMTMSRDSSGSISQVTYGPLTVQITRNSDGSIASVETSIPSDSIKQVDTINRNPDGSISGVTRQWPS
jgi:hypothetical protein